MNTTHREDVKGDFNACKELFLLAEIHRNEKLSVEDSKKPERPAKGFSESKSRMKKGNGCKNPAAATPLSQAISYASSAARMVTGGGGKLEGTVDPLASTPHHWQDHEFITLLLLVMSIGAQISKQTTMTKQSIQV